MTGASLGTVALVQVGCSPSAPQADEVGKANLSIARGQEGALCEAALNSSAASDVDRLIAQYPSSPCIAPILNAMPASTLAALSPSSLLLLDGDVADKLDSRVVAQLPTDIAVAATTPVSSPLDVREDKDDRQDRY